MELKLKANETVAYVIVERDGAEDVHEKPSELVKMTYAGRSADGTYGFTDPAGEIHFVEEATLPEVVFTDKKVAEKAWTEYFEFWKLELAKESYAFLECEMYATHPEQASFDKFITGVKSKKHLYAMATSLGFEGKKLEGSPAACVAKIKTMYAQAKADVRDAHHKKVLKSLGAMEKKFGASVKEFSHALALAKREEAKKAKVAQAAPTPKGKK